MPSRHDRPLLDTLKAHAAIVRPGLLRALGLEAAEHGSPEPCPACDATGTVWRLRPDPPGAVRISCSMPMPRSTLAPAHCGAETVNGEDGTR